MLAARRSSLPVWTIAALLMMVICAARPASAQGQPFTVYWCIGPYPGITHGSTPFNHNFVLFNQDSLGEFPVAGPHLLELAQGGREAAIQRHLVKISASLAATIPNVNWAGHASIDWEAWWPFWSGQNGACIEAWKNFIRVKRPQLIAGMSVEEQEVVFRDTWLAITREFWSRTLGECKRLRPNVKWGFYSLPATRWYAWLDTNASNSEREQLLRANTVELAWLFDEVDVIYPSLYIPYQGVANPVPQLLQVPEADVKQFLRLNMFEATRISDGKAVVPFIWPQYLDSEPLLSGKWLNQHDMRASFEVLKQNGAAGVIVWGYVPYQNQSLQQQWQQHLTTHVYPLVSMFAEGGESGGGGGTSPLRTQPPPHVIVPGMASGSEVPTWWGRALPHTPFQPGGSPEAPAWLARHGYTPSTSSPSGVGAGFFSREDVLRALERAGR